MQDNNIKMSKNFLIKEGVRLVTLIPKDFLITTLLVLPGVTYYICKLKYESLTFNQVLLATTLSTLFIVPFQIGFRTILDKNIKNKISTEYRIFDKIILYSLIITNSLILTLTISTITEIVVAYQGIFLSSVVVYMVNEHLKNTLFLK
jgi:hypothetical protein